MARRVQMLASQTLVKVKQRRLGILTRILVKRIGGEHADIGKVIRRHFRPDPAQAARTIGIRRKQSRHYAARQCIGFRHIVIDDRAAEPLSSMATTSRST